MTLNPTSVAVMGLLVIVAAAVVTYIIRTCTIEINGLDQQHAQSKDVDATAESRTANLANGPAKAGGRRPHSDAASGQDERNL